MATSWRELFKDLKIRGLKHDRVILGIMDGLTGMEKVFKEEFPNAECNAARSLLPEMSWQRSQESSSRLLLMV